MGTDEKTVRNERIAETLTLAVASICAAAGTLLLAFNDVEHYVIIIGLGLIFILFGIMHVAGYFLHTTLRPHNRFDFSLGLFDMIIGALLFFVSHRFAEHFSIVIGLMLMFKAVTWLQTTMEMKESDKKRFHIETIYAVVLFAVGLGFVIYDFEEEYHGVIYHGVALIIEGAVEAYSVISCKIARKKEKNAA